MRRLPALAVLLLLAAPAAADELDVDLSKHFVAITTGFTGANVTLFGAVDRPGDIIVVVRGPDRDRVVRRKRHLAGIWLNTRTVVFPHVPGSYEVLSTRPVDQLLPAELRTENEIGVDALNLKPVGASAIGDVSDYRRAMLQDVERSGLYATEPGKIARHGPHLFSTLLQFPAIVPTGAYSVIVYLVRDGAIVDSESVPLAIEQTGFEDEVSDFAELFPALYGFVAVIAAAMAGWVASLLFRNA